MVLSAGFPTNLLIERTGALHEEHWVAYATLFFFIELNQLIVCQ